MWPPAPPTPYASTRAASEVKRSQSQVMATPNSTTEKLKSASSKLLRSMSLGRKGRSSSKSRPSLSRGGASADRVTAFKLDDVPLDTVLTKNKPKVVVAIDFGTTYSGYAYAFVERPEDVHLMRRSSGSHLGLQSYKLPTVLLLRENQDFLSFGYEARETYADMDETESLKHLYFEKFKMELHSRRVSSVCTHMHTQSIVQACPLCACCPTTAWVMRNA